MPHDPANLHLVDITTTENRNPHPRIENPRFDDDAEKFG